MPFDKDAVALLDFDLTGIPREDGTGYLTEKGVVTEPSEARINAFPAKFTELGAQVKTAGENTPEGVNTYREMQTAIIELCGGTPSDNEIRQLSPRYLVAFFRWLMRELQPPKD